MNMLTGMFSPTSGTAYVDGHDVTTNIAEARNSLGLCPQHNILINELTVKEHLIFYCRLKGLSNSKEIQAEIDKYTELLEFTDKTNALSKTLSGGQKRKLSIGVALCGNSKIVMLDEPTSGLDAGARRSLWNLLIQEKKGRTVLLTTHHMDEADILADRIAIMNEGQLQTVGSSFFLKKRFGSGYKLICVKKQGCHPRDILQVLTEFAPDAQLESDAQTEAVFIIKEDHLPNFPSMFKRIEDESETLRISSFGCSMTSLEEVFIKVGSANKSDQQHQSGLEFNDFLPSKRVTGLKLALYQIHAMLLKKFHYTRRNFYSIGWLTLMSVFIMYLCLIAPIEFDFIYREDPPIPQDVSLSSFNKTLTAIEHDGSKPQLFESYRRLFGGKDAVDVIAQGNFTDYILKKFQISESTTNRENIIGLTITNEKILAWKNPRSTFSTLLEPLSLNLINRAILKSTEGEDHDIFVSSRPYNVTATDRTETTETTITTSEMTSTEPISRAEGAAEEEQLTKEEELSFDSKLINFIVIFLMFYLLLGYWPSIFIAVKVKERVTRAKLLQFISGANRFIYWLTSFVIDFVFLMAVASIIVGVLAINQRVYFRTGEQLGTLMAIFAAYGFSTIPFIYAASFLFEKHPTSETMVSVYALVCE